MYNLNNNPFFDQVKAERAQVAKPSHQPIYVKPDLALRIARAMMPQMSVDAQNGNRVAQDGITHLVAIAQKEIDK